MAETERRPIMSKRPRPSGRRGQQDRRRQGRSRAANCQHVRVLCEQVAALAVKGAEQILRGSQCRCMLTCWVVSKPNLIFCLPAFSPY
jgi:hypothetical protein